MSTPASLVLNVTVSDVEGLGVCTFGILKPPDSALMQSACRLYLASSFNLLAFSTKWVAITARANG